MRGLLVAFEGIDGGGKSTQAQRLVRDLTDRGVRAIYTKEPTDGPHGRAIRATATTGRLPPEEELALFVADRREHVTDQILPELAAGTVVVIDRYYLSTAAYQGARGLDPARILAENEAFAPAPDVCFVLDVDPSVGVGRVRGRDGAPDLFEHEDELRRCRAVFDAIDRPWIVRLDASAGPDVVAAQVRARVDGLLR